MTEDRPNKADLLSIARAHLLDRVLPNVAEASRLDVLMVANAMAIAARETAGPTNADQPYAANIAAVLGGEPAGEQLDSELVMQIRAGAFDAPGAKRSALLDYLDQDLRRRLALANPRYLDRRSGEQSFTNR